MQTQPLGKAFSSLVIQFEEDLRDKSPEEWYDATIKVVDGLFDATMPRGLSEAGVMEHTVQHWYTRVAAGLTKYASCPKQRVNAQQLLALTKRKQQIVYIFNASGYRNTGHLLTQIGRNNNGDITIPLDRLAIYFAFASLDDLQPRLLQLALSQEPNVVLMLMMGWLNQRAILTEQGESNRSTLLASGERILESTMSDEMIQPLVNAWMYSTYADAPHKHDVKRHINTLLKGLLGDSEAVAVTSARELRQKPVMLVIHERFIKQHAMYRCYAPHLRRLKDKFCLIALAETDNIDDGSDDIFEQIIRIEEKIKNVPKIVRQIGTVSPDVIYYPSLGMSHWTVMLAQLRLAPIQIMTHGHPGTSMSDAIDYAYVSDLQGDVANLHSEKILLGSRYASFAPHSDLPVQTPPLLEPSDREVRVAVNSKVMKLSHRLLSVCKRLNEQASVPVKFSFFPGERGLFFDGLAPAIKAQVPDAEVVQYVDYRTFLAEMCRCDLALAAFPFGNTNSTVDTCLLGLPTVVHFGAESPAQTDKMVLETAGYPDWLVCDSDEQYFETALKLINDPNLRKSVTDSVDPNLVRTRLFAREDSEFGEDPLADVFRYVYDHHEDLQASSDRVFRYQTLLDIQT